MATANLKAKISLDTSSFSRGIAAARSQIAAIGSSMSTVSKIGVTAAAALAGLAAVSFGKGIKETLDFGSSMKELSDRIGTPVKEAMILGQAFKDAGLGADEVGPSINKMQKELVNGGDSFKRLGLNIEQIKKLSPTAQFQAVAGAIKNLKDPAEQTTAAMEVFGRSGGKLLNLFKDSSGIDNAAKIIGSQADIFQRNAEQFDRLSDTFNAIGVKFRGFFAGVAESLLPALNKAADALASIDLAPMGQALGNAISSAINILTNAFQQGKLGALVGLSVKTGLATAADFLIEAIRAAVDILGDSVARIFSMDFFSGLVIGFAGLGKKITAFLIAAFQTPLTYLSAGLAFAFKEAAKMMMNLFNPILGQLGKKLIEASGFDLGIKDFIEGSKSFYNSDTAKQMSAEGDSLFKMAGDSLSPVKDDIFKIIKERLGNFKPADVFGSKELQSQLAGLAQSLNIPLEKVKEAASAVASTTPTGSLMEKTGKAFSADGDRLAKIGGFAGGAANVAMNFARRTADNTMRIAKATEGMLKKLGESPSGGATWAES